MIVHLSISSSSNNPPQGRWLMIWLATLICVLSVTLYFEVKIRQLGWLPSVVDSVDLWSAHRMRASELGSGAMIFIGASRAQLGIDLNVVREISSYEPVQLAIDGTSFMPVLESLANDERITGTVVVSLTMNNIKTDYENELSSEWVDYFNSYQQNIEPYKVIDSKINSFLDNHLAIRLEGAKPVTNIYYRLFTNKIAGNYLTTNNDRSRDADYKKVRMPGFYIRRLIKNYGDNLTYGKEKISSEEILLTYSKAIKTIKSVKIHKDFSHGLEIMIRSINQIESRGGKVFLVRFPSDKMIFEIEKRRFPKEVYWNEIVKRHSASIHFSDYPLLSRFNLPDGLHLDLRDKKQFTQELMKIIKEGY